MFRNLFLSFFLSLLLNCLLSASTGYCISDWRSAKQLNATDDIAEGNETSSFQNLVENNTTSADDNDGLFWTVPPTNETTEDEMMLQTDNQELITEETNAHQIGALKEEEKEVTAVQESNLTEIKPTEKTEMDEKIVLQRTNCHLEIAIQNSYDLKIQIMFGQLQNNTSGRCCITLNGSEDSLLAVLISDIYLYQNGSDREVLKVITLNHGSAYILKEYYHKNSYQPLLLTETHTIYLVLYYKVTTIFPSETQSHFNLEVLTYHKNENYGQPKVPEYFSAFSPPKNQNLSKFYTSISAFPAGPIDLTRVLANQAFGLYSVPCGMFRNCLTMEHVFRMTDFCIWR